ncbi:unnamed protein product [Ranitomeya imitator]|uniref:Annexin n=1 Tax=Ranitomeya imitator TaxID=111125 RepID=A0ABN9KYS7_9NEOB|nr:unnamed protein product [Ranitomeya imitator]
MRFFFYSTPPTRVMRSSLIYTMSFVQEFLRQAFYLDENAEHATKAASQNLLQFSSLEFFLLKGVDEATITNILTKRNNAQRQAIKAAYKSSTGKPLEDALKKALSGHYEEVVLALLKTPAEFDAQELKHATKGLGTDEDALIEILASRTNKELREINRVYKELYKNDLAKDITSDTSGDFQKALLALAKGDRSEDTRVNDELVDNDARALYDAGEKKKGTDVSVFINILTTRSSSHLQKALPQYASVRRNVALRRAVHDASLKVA